VLYGVRCCESRFDDAPPVSSSEIREPNKHFVNRLGINALTSAEPGYPNGGAVFHDTAVWIRRVDLDATARL
jgi:hypothetical protein